MCVYVYMCSYMCAQEHALAAHSKHTHIKAIIISPFAITTTSDSPLPAKLIYLLVPSVLPPPPPFPPAIATLTNPFLRRFSSSSFLFYCSSFFSVADNAKKSQFSTCLYLLRGCYAILRCVCIQSLTVAVGHAPHPRTRTE